VSVVNRYLEPALVEHLNQMQLSARSVVQGTSAGLHRSRLKGSSIEFKQHRFYVAGDEVRRLDWRVLGRTDRTYVKEYDEETNLRCVLMLDRSGSMAYGSGRLGTKAQYAAKLVAALAYLMLGQTESVGLAVSGDGLEHWLAPHAGSLQLSRVLESLERGGDPAGPSGIAASMHAVADRLERRGLIVVVSDFFTSIDALRGGLAHLRHARHEVIAVQVVHRDEETFPFRNWVRFRGIEGEAAVLCEPAVVRKTYQENFRRHRKALREACLALRAEFQSVTSDKPMLDTLRQVLKR
jgi:uncharacterized protein (DUF58 family)